LSRGISTPQPESSSNEQEKEEEERGTQNEEGDESVEENGGEDVKARQVLRMNYRKLIIEANDNRDSYSSQQLVTSIKTADKLFKEVKHTREATLDYEFSDLTMQIAVNNANKLTTGFKGYSIDEYVSKMSNVVKEDTFYNTYVKEFVIRETPSRVFLYGGLDVKLKERVVREKKAKDQLADKVSPKTVEQNKKEELDMTKRVKKINTKLFEETEGENDGEEKPTDFWTFINDSSSFATTVENLFHFSFLVHEGNASIEKKKEGIEISTATPPKQQGIAPENIKNQQCVIRLDYKLWEENSKRAQESQKKATPQKRQKKLTDS